ncbi:hypothetical protein MSAN_00172500 [Mycena sanguinolenta]|uniref:Uncharacterized protein n=1 Tax=Mycena sanguinolenta TaxID=230812 RepID=A0A8H6ZH88_9AGAR|nr:hypothetical protein MSAN_00172500 [Mycena sanguinolenta]
MLFIAFVVSCLVSFYVYLSETRKVKNQNCDLVEVVQRDRVKNTNTLSHRLGINAWLLDFEGEKIEFAKPPIVEGKKITAVIAVNKLTSLKYQVAWCKHRGTPDMNTMGGVERSEPGGEMSRLANISMGTDDPHSQSVWTRESLLDPLVEDAWLEIPCDRESLVTLKISLLNRPAKWTVKRPRAGKAYWDSTCDPVNEEKDLPDMIFHFKFTLE